MVNNGQDVQSVKQFKNLRALNQEGSNTIRTLQHKQLAK